MSLTAILRAALLAAVTPALRVTLLLASGKRCVSCGTRGRLQIDHVRPRAAGGVTALGWLAPLCADCNRTKSNYWPGHGYRPFPGYDDISRAREILAAELAWLAARYPTESAALTS